MDARAGRARLLSGKLGVTRLGFAVALRFFAREGRFPAAEEVAVRYVASQVDVAAAEYGAYDHRGRTAEHHRAQIRETFGFRQATVRDAEEIGGWLLEEVGPREYDLERTKEAAYARLRALKVEPPTPGRVERAARSALRRHDERFREQTLARLSPETLAELDALLIGGETLSGGATAGPVGADEKRAREAEEATLSRLRADPGRASLESVFAEIAKLARLRAVGLPDDLFADVQPRVVRAYRRRAAAEPPSSLRAHAPAVRYALLAALCHERLPEVTNGLVDLLVRIVHKIGARAERKVERAMVKDFRRVHGKQGMLVRVAEASLRTPTARCARWSSPRWPRRRSSRWSGRRRHRGPPSESRSKPGCAPRTWATTAGWCPRFSPLQRRPPPARAPGGGPLARARRRR